MSRLLRWAPWAIGVEIAVAGYLSWARHPVAFDDAFITYRYADNLVAGHGAVYNPGERVEGYTNPLWMLLAAGGIALGQDPLAVTRAVGVLSHCAMLLLIAAICSRWLLQAGAAWIALLPLLALLVLPDGFAAMAGSGLETSFVGCLLVGAGVVLGTGDLSRGRDRMLLAAVLAAAVITRPDAMLAVAAAGVAILFGTVRAREPLSRGFETVAQVGAPIAAVFAIATTARYAYYGEFPPNTYYARAADVAHIEEGITYIAAFCRSHAHVGPLVVLMLCGLVSRTPRVARLACFATLTTFMALAYIAKVGGDFMEFRFMWQLYGLVVLGAGAGLVTIADAAKMPAVALVAAALSVAFQPTKLETEFGMQSIDEMQRYVEGGTNVGARLGAVLPKDTIIATTLAGSIAYYSKLTVIDQWGLNDKFVARMPYKAKQLSRGHVKFAPLDYLQKRGVNLYIEHPAICSCTRPCRENKPNVFVRLGNDECMRSWYLTQTDALTRHFCARPEEFMLHRVPCPPPLLPSATPSAGQQILDAAARGVTASVHKLEHAPSLLDVTAQGQSERSTR